MSDGNSSTDEIKQITAELQSSVENLRKLAGIRAERLNEAAQSFQVLLIAAYLCDKIVYYYCNFLTM